MTDIVHRIDWFICNNNIPKNYQKVQGPRFTILGTESQKYHISILYNII